MFPPTTAQALVVPARPTVVPYVPTAGSERQATISELLPYYLAHARFELRFSEGSVTKYQDCLRWIIRFIGDIAPQQVRTQHVLLIKARCAERQAGPSRTASVICALKSFLKFCRFSVGLETIDPTQIHSPRIPKREVLFLSPEEVRQYVAAIPVRKSSRKFDLKWLCFRALVEVLLGTGMRISEALSLKRSSVNLQTGEAAIIGKGNKGRTVFFSPRALNWLKEYLTRRADKNDALFMATKNVPLRLSTAIARFRRFRKQAGMNKKITAHILRHTVATTLLFNGCPIGHIKEILGHEHLQTTCKFYLGTDRRAAREAHHKFLTYEQVGTADLPRSEW